MADFLCRELRESYHFVRQLSAVLGLTPASLARAVLPHALGRVWRELDKESLSYWAALVNEEPFYNEKGEEEVRGGWDLLLTAISLCHDKWECVTRGMFHFIFSETS